MKFLEEDEVICVNLSLLVFVLIVIIPIGAKYLMYMVILFSQDETMHSGADVEAFTAALNRDIEGDTTSTSQPPTTTDAGGGISQFSNCS